MKYGPWLDRLAWHWTVQLIVFADGSILLPFISLKKSYVLVLIKRKKGTVESMYSFKQKLIRFNRERGSRWRCNVTKLHLILWYLLYLIVLSRSESEFKSCSDESTSNSFGYEGEVVNEDFYFLSYGLHNCTLKNKHETLPTY